jgi:hypothetical protein
VLFFDPQQQPNGWMDGERDGTIASSTVSRQVWHFIFSFLLSFFLVVVVCLCTQVRQLANVACIANIKSETSQRSRLLFCVRIPTQPPPSPSVLS